MNIEPKNNESSVDNPLSSIQRVNLLLVDDRPENLLTLGELLDSPDYNLVKARSGKEALRCLLKDDFAVILLDVQMPEMDGYKTAEFIRKRRRSGHTPIIFVTAAERDAMEIVKGYSAGAVDYLLKPLVPEILKAKVAVFVELFKKTETMARQTELLAQKFIKEQEAKKKLSQLTEELKRSNAELEQFAYVASHDLQEPLRMVTSYVQLLARRFQGQLDQEADEFIAYAVDGADRMRTLINDLLKYSRLSTQGKEFKLIQLDDTLTSALTNLKIAVEKSGAVVSHDPLPSSKADNVQMIQLFQNLIGNAIKFHGDESTKIHVSYSEFQDLSFTSKIQSQTLNMEPETCVFSVRDNGIGIDPDYHERVFVIFQRLHNRKAYSGTGIGLAVCKKIVERHGGRIWVESEPGKGTTFFFTLAGER